MKNLTRISTGLTAAVFAACLSTGCEMNSALDSVNDTLASINEGLSTITGTDGNTTGTASSRAAGPREYVSEGPVAVCREFSANEMRARKMYIGKYVKGTGKVAVNSTGVIVVGKGWEIYTPGVEDQMSLSNGDSYTIDGVITDIDSFTSEFANGCSLTVE